MRLMAATLPSTSKTRASSLESSSSSSAEMPHISSRSRMSCLLLQEILDIRTNPANTPVSSSSLSSSSEPSSLAATASRHSLMTAGASSSSGSSSAHLSA